MNAEFTPRSITDSSTVKVSSACGKLYVMLDWFDGRLVSVTVPSVKPGGCLATTLETICSLSRLALISGADPESIIRSLRGRSCHKSGALAQTCTDAIADGIEIALREKTA